MTKTKRQLRAEAVERLKNDAGARFSPDAIVCALLGGRRGKIDWSLECDAILDLLTRWLDRQAAITHSIDAWNIKRLQQQLKVAQDVNERQDIEYLGQCEKIAELQEKVDEQRKSLEAAWEDNAELTDQLESAHAKNRALKAHISKMQEGRHGWHIKAAKLQSQVDKLTAECGECVYKQEFASIDELQTKVDALTQANADYREEWHRVCRERDDLQRKLHESNREREQIRKQLGIAIDHAHDMIALVSVDTDEGAE